MAITYRDTFSVSEPASVPSSVAWKSGDLSVSVYRGGQEIVDLHADAWRTLCDRAGAESTLHRPDVVTAYFDAFAPGSDVVLLAAYRDGKLVALLPLHELSVGCGPARISWLHSAANIHTPRFDAIVGDAGVDEIAKAFWRCLRNEFPRHLCYFEFVNTDGVISRMRDLARIEGWEAREHDSGASPYIRVPASPVGAEEIIAAQGKSLRSSLRRGLRRLEAQGAVRFVHVRKEAEGRDVAEWLEEFCELEHRGWKGDIGTSINSNEITSRFYRSLAREKALRLYFRCLALMLDDEMIAGDIGLMMGDTYFSMKLVINEDFLSSSPGHLIQMFELVDFAGRGVREIDLGGQAEPYKMRWTDTVRPYTSVFIFPPGLRGRLLEAAVLDGWIRAKEYLRTKPLARRVRWAMTRWPWPRGERSATWCRRARRGHLNAC